jgi:hypothetical protein
MGLDRRLLQRRHFRRAAFRSALGQPSNQAFCSCWRLLQQTPKRVRTNIRSGRKWVFLAYLRARAAAGSREQLSIHELSYGL